MKQVVKIGLLGLLVFLVGNTALAAEPPVNGTARLDELQQQAVALMLKSHPSLLSQRRIVASSQGIEIPEKGLISSLDLSAGLGSKVVDNEVKPVPTLGIDFNMPLLSADNQIKLVKEKQELTRTLEGDIQQLQEMEGDLIGQLSDKINQLIQLQHRSTGRQKLITVLKQRQRNLQDLIQAGVAQPSDLWELDERITNLGVETADIKSQAVLLINETALKFGGDNSQQLKELLEEIATVSEVVSDYGQ